ncbi:hypothetical protein OMAG_002778 [Candidatus Omnitrophus magneticus]|uniref:Polymerase nucleotidyl transferase domain-containing protein n=1 Tax=Candidatus Omnitrophus magneticus TaxID=1609969 RepID=A0A0F0CMX2_9BACT|nr:hypothetical protein OMAG_002778 [Candidatus Omnitrophus magneticus]
MVKKYKFIKSVGLYGSCAKGENNEESDLTINPLAVEDIISWWSNNLR